MSEFQVQILKLNIYKESLTYSWLLEEQKYLVRIQNQEQFNLKACENSQVLIMNQFMSHLIFHQALKMIMLLPTTTC